MATVRLLAFLAIFPGTASAAGPVTFEKDIKPIFKQHCIGCHNADRRRGGLDLSTMAQPEMERRRPQTNKTAEAPSRSLLGRACSSSRRAFIGVFGRILE
jgi:mono/diheme cytochrome c family protein